MNDDSTFESVIVLVVEDETFSLRFVSRILENRGVANVVGAGDGSEALEILEMAETPIDLAIRDIEMPVMDGYELIRRIRCGAVPEYQDVPVLMLTGKDTGDKVDKGRIHKIDGFIVKPPNAVDLERRMRKVLGL